MEEINSFDNIDTPSFKREPRPTVGRDLMVALRLRQLLSGHIDTWVILRGIRTPYPQWHYGMKDPYPAWVKESGSQSRTVYFRLEPYVGQMKNGTITDAMKDERRRAKNSGIDIEVRYSSKGRVSYISAAGIHLTIARGWQSYRIKQIMDGIVQEVMAVARYAKLDEAFPDRHHSLRRAGITTLPEGIKRVAIHEDESISYIRTRGTYKNTHRVTRRGMVGRIHGSEPTSAQHSAYPGW